MNIATLARAWSGVEERHRHLALAALLGAGYWALATYSLALPVRSSGISYVWPADGLALGALLCTRKRQWPYYLAAVFAGNFLASNKPLALNLLYSSFNAFEPLLVATVLTALLGARPRIESVQGALRFMFLTMAVMAMAILLTNSIDWLIHRGDFWKIWAIWCVSNTLGMLIIAPLMLAFSGDARREIRGWSRYRAVEATVLLVGLVVTTNILYSAAPGELDRWINLSRTPMLAPMGFLVWAAVRFALPGGTLAIAILALQSFWYTANGRGPYAALDPDSHAALLHLQVTLVVASIILVVVAAVATEWRQALAESRAARKRLERALESARLALFEVEVAGGRIFLTEGWAEMVGAEPGETHATVSELLELVHPEERDVTWEAGVQALSGKREDFEVETRVRRRDGQWIWILSRGRAVERDASGRTSRIAGTILDITERKRTEQRLHYLATRDALTDLTNRALFGEGVQQAVDEAARWSHRVAVISIGLDRFTAINDSLGQHVGDLVLKAVAARLTDAVGRDVTVARPGGDEFLLLMPIVRSTHEAAGVVENALAAISRPIPVERRELVVTASAGIAFYPDDADSAGLLLRNADIALHSAKEAGRNNVQFFAERMNVAARSRLEIEGALRQGLERNQLLVYYQPLVELATGALVGYEALARWRHPKRGLVLPEDFISIAESTGLIVALGRHVLATACRQAAIWRDAGGPPVHVAVNVTARQLRHRDFVKDVEQALAAERLDPRLLELEITENSIIEHGPDTTATLDAIGRLGVQLAIDDFGTGYSSLSYLKRLPIDTVKIDRSFVADLPEDPDACALVGAIIALAHNLGLKVLAEGVETEAQSRYLREHGCERAQGFLFGEPRPPEMLQVGADGRPAIALRDASA